MINPALDENFVKKYYEKEEIKKYANRICFTLLITSAVMVLWSYAVRLAFGVLNLDIRKFIALIQTDEGSAMLQIFVSCIAFLPTFALLAKNCGITSYQMHYNRPKRKNLTAILLFGMSMCALTNIASTLGGAVFESLGIHYEADLTTSLPDGFFGFLLSIISTAVVPAFIEEFAMRGVVLNILRPFGDGFAVVVSSAMFGFMHGNFEQIPFTFAIGIVLGYTAVYTNSILPAMFIHFFNNGMNVILEYITRNMDTLNANILYYVYITVLLVLGAVSLFFLKDEKLNLNKSDTALTFSEKIKCYFLSPVAIVYIVAVLIEAFFIYAK